MSVKNICLFVLASFLTLGSLHAAGSSSKYQEAVDSYINAATVELEAIHTQAEALSVNASDGAEAEFESLNTGLTRCDQLLAKLKKADSGNFDVLKAQYETTKHTVMQSIAEIQDDQG